MAADSSCHPEQREGSRRGRFYRRSFALLRMTARARMTAKLLLLITALFQTTIEAAPSDIYTFATSQQRLAFEELTQNSRCLVCQNQSLADSDASLAKDLRNDIYTLLIQGKNEQEIQRYLTQRYGDFILFKPPLNASTYLLWFAPFLLLLLGFTVLYRLYRRSR